MRRITVSVVAFVLLLPITPANAQSITWTDQFGTRKADRAWGVLAAGGDVYVVGETAGRLGGSSLGSNDGFLRRYTADGTLVWSVAVGTSAPDYVFGVAMDATGIYVVGQTELDATRRDPGDGLLVKFDTDGNELWSTTFGSGRWDLGSYLVADGTGVYVVGSTSGRLEGQERVGDSDAFLIRFDQDGNQTWAVQFGSSSTDFGYANAVTPFGILVSGFTGGRFDSDRPARNVDAFAALYDPAGNEVWSRVFGTSDVDYAYGVASDATGLYVSGQTFGRFRGSERVSEGRTADSFVRKFSPLDGSRVWIRQFGTERSDASLAIDVRGTEVIAGGWARGTFPGQTSGGRSDLYLASFDAATGDAGWTLQFGSPGNDQLNWLDVDGDVLYAVGEVNGALPGMTSSGESDAFVNAFALESPVP